MKKRKIEEYIKEILISNYGDRWENIYNNSELIQYLNLKSNAIHGDVKSRRSLANWYAIYSILHFYKEEGFINKKNEYQSFEGFQYTKLFEFQRSQYGGEKLQNHGFNSRVNSEFINKIANDKEKNPIIINDGKYLIHPDYLYVDGKDITETVLSIIKKYQEILKDKDTGFITVLNNITNMKNIEDKKDALCEILNEDTEARVFEIISFAILEAHYKNIPIYIGWTRDDIEKKYLNLYKTGRTNANDGGIDFVMKPLGRFFQVTEVNNYDKYFLDMEKVNHFPITFVVKTKRASKEIKNEIEKFLIEKTGGMKVLKDRYLNSLEDVITIQELVIWMSGMTKKDINYIVDEINRYYKLEMNID